MRKMAALVAILTATAAFGASQTSDTGNSTTAPKSDRSATASSSHKAPRHAVTGTGSAQAATTNENANANEQNATKPERDQLAKDDFDLKGRVSRVSSRSVTVDRDGTTPATLQVDRATKIEVNGKAAKLADVKAGDDVKASFNLRGERPIAVELKASSK